ncbi:hypothetical protein EPI10_033127 [Gossypium australe]|uniref:Uncharacterized protein n=1 Tax=Gossypium australe TaxID=47621 RepID=A0A5B6X6P8_9ROSI|nr:hypothetical protein EPI10_033127 [Gossypium australe]
MSRHISNSSGLDIFPATRPISGRLSGSTCTQSNASCINFSATSTGNESFILLSTHCLNPSLPSAVAAVAVSITDVLRKSPVSLSYRYFNGSSPDSSSKITTPKAKTSDFCVTLPLDLNSGDM